MFSVLWLKLTVQVPYDDFTGKLKISDGEKCELLKRDEEMLAIMTLLEQLQSVSV